MNPTIRRIAYVLAVALWAVAGVSGTLAGCSLVDRLADTGHDHAAATQPQTPPPAESSVGAYIGYAIDGLILTALGGGVAYHRRAIRRTQPGQTAPAPGASNAPPPADCPSPG